MNLFAWIQQSFCYLTPVECHSHL